MDSGTVLKECSLPNGLQVTVTDVSRHYYGGYWQVCLEVSCLVSLELGQFSDPAIEADARRLLGATVPFVRHLEKMAVHGDELESSKKKLLDRFENTIMPFLANNLFAPRFIQTEYQQRRKKQTRGIPSQL